jgi:hypothetical protein
MPGIGLTDIEQLPDPMKEQDALMLLILLESPGSTSEAQRMLFNSLKETTGRKQSSIEPWPMRLMKAGPRKRVGCCKSLKLAGQRSENNYVMAGAIAVQLGAIR